MTRGATEPEFDPFDIMFPEGAPNVSLGGLDVIRATINWDPDTTDPNGPELEWILDAYTSKENPRAPVAIMGELRIQKDGWFVGAAVLCPLSFNKDVPDLDDVNALARVYGSWASNPLYDFAAGVARSLIGLSQGCSIAVPVQTPVPTFLVDAAIGMED